ncbi:hypothetical protein HanIR_Chr13g0656601 [Helianthus annuus]|nr:hypothetical protein HanIR_Chr13g0656601 [Helianthus annuus]
MHVVLVRLFTTFLLLSHHTHFLITSLFVLYRYSYLSSHTLPDLNQPSKFFFLSQSFIINHQNSRSTSVTTR